jgi:hypothetical protein
MIAGAAGDAGGLMLDATGVGALVGVPANIVSTAAIIAGGAMVAGSSPLYSRHTSPDLELQAFLGTV